ncbi:MAG: class I SAM-dependent methyltransferase [Bdellovibrionales bacterium]
MINADKDTDARYEFLRNRHGKTNPQANGYRVSSFFQREQRIILSALDKENGPFLDVACGSGLMLEPLVKEGHTVYGLDFNSDACAGAKSNGINILRGDAFHMPLPDNTIGQIINCQFLNQQTTQQTEKFIQESARVLKKGGRLIILWRHANSMIHKSSHAVFTLLDKFTGQPPFPQYEHPMKEIQSFANEAGLAVLQDAVTLPFLKPDTICSNGLAAKIIGASLFVVLEKR